VYAVSGQIGSGGFGFFSNFFKEHRELLPSLPGGFPKREAEHRRLPCRVEPRAEVPVPRDSRPEVPAGNPRNPNRPAYSRLRDSLSRSSPRTTNSFQFPPSPLPGRRAIFPSLRSRPITPLRSQLM
jgi:hypothetical protein